MADEAETHKQRCQREAKEQEKILAQVKEDSDRYDAEIAKEQEAPLALETPAPTPRGGKQHVG